MNRLDYVEYHVLQIESICKLMISLSETYVEERDGATCCVAKPISIKNVE